MALLRALFFTVLFTFALGVTAAQDGLSDERKREILQAMRNIRMTAKEAIDYTADDVSQAHLDWQEYLYDTEFFNFAEFVYVQCLDRAYAVNNDRGLPSFSTYVERRVATELGFIPGCTADYYNSGRLRVEIFISIAGDDYPMAYLVELETYQFGLGESLRAENSDEYRTWVLGVSSRETFVDTRAYEAIDSMVRDFADEVFQIWRLAGLVGR